MPEAAASSAEVVGGRIVLHAPFAHLVLCKRIPGAGWAAARRAWVYPATLRHAQMIRASIPRLDANGDFHALLSPQAPVAPVKSPEPEPAITLPAGLSTKPWRHQVAAYDFCREHFAAGRSGILLAMGMGTGKSLVACMLTLGLDAKRVLIACPLRVVPVWMSQFERHVNAPVVIIALDEDAGSAEKRTLAEEKMRLADARGVPFICVINYDSAWRDPFAEWAEKQSWDLVIADEAHGSRLRAARRRSSSNGCDRMPASGWR